MVKIKNAFVVCRRGKEIPVGGVNADDLARCLKSPEFRQLFPAAGDDYKIMGYRVNAQATFIVALAFIAPDKVDLFQEQPYHGAYARN